MVSFKLKVLFCVAIGFMFLFAPCMLSIHPDGTTFAMGGGGGGSNSGGEAKRTTGGYSVVDETPGPTPVPEPATWLLVGSGVAGLAGFVALRKKKKK